MNALARQITQDHIRASGLRVGIDIVCVSHVHASLASFGLRFVERLFSPHEAAYAMSGGDAAAERLAARFAAKEATLKAFDLSDEGINWRDIEVFKCESGSCELRLHRRAAELVAATAAEDIALSLTHDGDYAAAVVTSRCRSRSPFQQAPNL